MCKASTSHCMAVEYQERYLQAMNIHTECLLDTWACASNGKSQRSHACHADPEKQAGVGPLNINRGSNVGSLFNELPAHASPMRLQDEGRRKLGVAGGCDRSNNKGMGRWGCARNGT